MKERTATQIRAEVMERHRAYSMLAEHPHLQAERIARHYMAHAELAREIMTLIEAKTMLNDSPNCDDVIEMLINQIKTNHRVELGIDLEWFKNPDRRQLEWLNQALNEGNGTYKP